MSRGFTLVETLVALAVTAVILAALAVAVPAALRAHDGATIRLERATTARTVLLHLERELAAAVREPTVVAATPAPRLEFTGGAEPGERLAYTLEGGALVRRTAPRFAAAEPGGPGVPLIDGVAALELHAFDGRDWVGTWRASEPPEAIRVRIVFADADPVETVATIPSARHRRPS